jgi:histidinol-phosphatase (PHP family)
LTLPPDDHTHSEWSWDAIEGSMERSCSRAVELGLPSIAFTEHVDLDRWHIDPEDQPAMRHGDLGPVAQWMVDRLTADDYFVAPSLDVDGYLESVERCRAKFPGLRIVTGLELGEPHRFADRCRSLLATGAFERVLGSLHTLDLGGKLWEVNAVYRILTELDLSPEDVIRLYLADTLRMVESSDLFAVLAHLDYPVRRFPTRDGPFDPTRFEQEYHAVLSALARSGRALEVNTRLPLDARIVRWWHEVGGDAVSFGSDAHEPAAVGTGFARAAAMVEAQGFRPGRTPLDFWTRSLTR